MKIAVLMSSYNGEKYIREQIDNVLNQRNVCVDLYVRDDGSSDGTNGILHEYEDRIQVYYGENVGVGSSFMQLVYDVPGDYDYYAFSDQDDIWLSQKLQKATERIEAEKEIIPVLYTSNQILVNEKGEETGIRYKQKPNTDYKQILCQNKLAGCTMVWNASLQRLLQEENRRPSKELLCNRIHDVWVAMVAAVTGKIVYDLEGYIYYRQHENNVVGVRNVCMWKQWMDKVKNPSLRNGRSILCKEIYDCYKDRLLNFSMENDLKCYGFYYQSKQLKKQLLQDKSLLLYTGESRAFFLFKVGIGWF